jgi:hypothetical protein
LEVGQSLAVVSSLLPITFGSVYANVPASALAPFAEPHIELGFGRGLMSAPLTNSLSIRQKCM